MGNPHYEEGEPDTAALNNHFDDTERSIRNFYFRLLTVAHKLDLPRCYGKDEFTKAMRLCVNLSENTNESVEDYQEMLQYVIGLIKQHGDMLCCNIMTNGTLYDVSRDYQGIFSEASTSLKRAHELIDCVTKPAFLYKLPNIDNETRMRLAR